MRFIKSSKLKFGVWEGKKSSFIDVNHKFYFFLIIYIFFFFFCSFVTSVRLFSEICGVFSDKWRNISVKISLPLIGHWNCKNVIRQFIIPSGLVWSACWPGRSFKPQACGTHWRPSALASDLLWGSLKLVPVIERCRSELGRQTRHTY